MAPRHTLVIGGTKGIGLALVGLLAEQQDAHISVIGRRSAPEAWSSLPNVHYWSVDLMQTDALDKVLSDVLDQHGPLNSLIFFQRYRDSADSWNGELQISLNATRHIIEYLVDSFGPGDKAIVIVSSIANRLIASEQPVGYHVAKAGLSQMARYYAVQLGSKGIRVNSVSPAIVLKNEARAFYAANPQLTDLYERLTPLGRMGTALEIAQVIQFLSSAGASFITGQDITVDGGVSIQWHESLARQLLDMTNINITRASDSTERK